jgi:hypothetical protein
MVCWRRILLAAWLAMSLTTARQLVLLHDLDHAADRIAGKGSHTGASCKLHFACSQLASAVGGKLPATLSELRSGYQPPLHRALAGGAPFAFAFQSRGPPIG